MEIMLKQIKQILSDLHDDDFDKRAAAAKSIIELPARLDISKDDISEIVFAVVDNFQEYFQGDYHQPGLFHHGEKYYPPNIEYKRILENVLEVLVGPIEEINDAIIEVFKYGSIEMKIKSSEWLGDHRVKKAQDVFY